MRRHGQGQVDWRFRQNRRALFFFERGILSCRGSIDGCHVDTLLRGERRLAFVAAGTSVETVMEVPGPCRYLVAFLDTAPLLGNDAELLRLDAPVSEVGFSDPLLTHALRLVHREVGHRDALSRLMLEGWAAQAWALLHRRATPHRETGALSGAGLRRVLGHMRERLGEDTATAELATLVGLGARQFCRRFRASTGSTPARMLETMRIERAAELLGSTRDSVTQIALACGSSQPQHLATAFRRRFGLTPSRYRAQCS